MEAFEWSVIHKIITYITSGSHCCNKNSDLILVVDYMNTSDFDIIKDNGRYLLIINEKYYEINEVTYTIFLEVKEGHTFDEISKLLYQKYDITSTPEELQKSITDIVTPLLKKEKVHNLSFMWYKVDLLFPKHYKKIADALRFLIKPYIFWPVLVLFLLFNLYKLAFLPQHDMGGEYCTDTLGVYFVTYLCLFFILIIHELGHVTATQFFKQKTYSIGFGLYLIFPVFYADVTNVWALSRYKRVVVNLGGIFFQSILGVLLFCCYTYIDLNDNIRYILHNVFIINGITMLVNLFPFFKFDGYWLYSDLFNLPNLSKKYQMCIRFWMKKIIWPLSSFFIEDERKYMNPYNPPLIIYSVLKVGVNIMLALAIINFLGTYINTFGSILKVENMDACSILKLVYKFAILTLLMIYFTKLLKTLYKTVRSKIY